MTVLPEERLLQLAAQCEKVILYSLLGTLLLVIVVQCFLGYPQPRYWILTSLPDSSVPVPAMAVMGEGEDTATIRMRLLGHQALRHAFVMAGQRRITNFSESEVEIKVTNGEEIAIDGTFYNRPLTFQVTGVSQGVLSPYIGQEVTTWGSQENLGKVRIDRTPTSP